MYWFGRLWTLRENLGSAGWPHPRAWFAQTTGVAFDPYLKDPAYRAVWARVEADRAFASQPHDPGALSRQAELWVWDGGWHRSHAFTRALRGPTRVGDWTMLHPSATVYSRLAPAGPERWRPGALPHASPAGIDRGELWQREGFATT